MSNKITLQNNVRTWHAGLLSSSSESLHHDLHKQPLDWWISLNERIYESLVMDTYVIPSRTFELKISGKVHPVEAKPRRLKANGHLFSYAQEDRSPEIVLAADIAAELNFEVYLRPLVDPKIENKGHLIFCPLLLAYTSSCSFDPNEWSCHASCKTYYASKWIIL